MKAMFQENIFRLYDIRGRYPKDFDDSFAYMLGAIFSDYIGGGTFVVARDARPSSDRLSKGIIEGIVSRGWNVIGAGRASTPLFYFGIREEGADGGIMVTASHLGEEFSGFKLAKKEAEVVGGAVFYEKNKEAFFSEGAASNPMGIVNPKNLLPKYKDAVIRYAGVSRGMIQKRIRIVGNEIAQTESLAIASELDITVVGEGEDVVFQFDSDSDRLTVLGRNGEAVRGDVIGGILAAYFYNGKSAVVDPRYSRGVLEYMHKNGVKTIPSRVGHVFIKETMRKHGAEFCAEGSGHIYFKEMGYAESSHLAMLKVLKMMHETGKGVDELAESIDNWERTNEISITVSSGNEAILLIEKVKKHYSSGHINTLDGIKVEYPEWGFLLRASNTEQKLRLILEAKTNELLEEKEGELLNVLQ